jgi:uncharacterized membrane protein
MTGLAALAHWSDRRTARLLAAACALGVVSSLITIVVNVPINNTITTWSPSALPAGYELVLRRWWNWHPGAAGSRVCCHVLGAGRHTQATAVSFRIQS